MQIGIFKGEFQYEAVNHFASDLVAAFARASVTPYEIDLNGNPEAAVALTRWLADQPETIGFLGFNGIAAYERLEGQERRIGNGKPYAAWLVDHPVIHLARIAGLAPDLILTIDSGHAAFLRELGLSNVVFLPHGGRCNESLSGHIHPWAERPMRLFMPGSLSDPDDLCRSVQSELHAKAGPHWAKLFVTLSDSGDVADDTALLAKAQAAAAALGLPSQMSGAFCYVLHQAIMAVRHRRRLQVLRGLDAAGIGVDLAGKGCGDFSFQNHRVLTVSDFPETLQRFAQSRFVLHINPLFCEAMHERAVYAGLAGAVVVTDGNRMLKRELAGGRGVVFDPDDIGGLRERLARLEASGDGAGMAAKGQRLMESRHSWDHRAAELIRLLSAQSNAMRAA